MIYILKFILLKKQRSRETRWQACVTGIHPARVPHPTRGTSEAIRTNEGLTIIPRRGMFRVFPRQIRAYSLWINQGLMFPTALLDAIARVRFAGIFATLYAPTSRICTTASAIRGVSGAFHRRVSTWRAGGLIAGVRVPLTVRPRRCVSGSACVHAEFRDGLFFALRLRPPPPLSAPPRSTALIRHSVHRGAQVWPMHSWRLRPLSHSTSLSGDSDGLRGTPR